MRHPRRCRPFRALTPAGWAAVAFVLALAGVLAQMDWIDLL